MIRDADALREEKTCYSLAIKHILALKSTQRNRVVERAFDRFVRETNVDEDMESGELFQALFLEWLLFDFNYKDGKSMLQHFVDYHPASISEDTIDGFRQSIASNRVGNFWIEHVFPREGIVVLSDFDTGEEFSVLDWSLSDQLGPNGCGMLGARLVCIDGQWLFAGNPVYYEAVMPTDEMKVILRSAAGKPPTFSDLVRVSFGTSVDEDAPDFVESAIYPTVAEQEARLNELEHLFDGWHAGKITALGWSDLSDAIMHDKSLDAGPGDLVRLLFPTTGDDILSLEAIDDLEEILGAVMDAWNLLPHDTLDGKSPTALRYEQ